VVTALSVAFAFVAADGGILMSLSSTVKPSVFVTFISFGIYVVSRVAGPLAAGRGRRPVPGSVTHA
jgi:zinc/manganese transport system permease protein